MESAVFDSRDRCIACNSPSLARVAGGRFWDEPLRSFIAADPWSVSPLPYVKQAQWEFVRCSCGQAFHRYVLTPEWQEIRFAQWMGERALSEFAERHGYNTTGVKFQIGKDCVAHLLKIDALTHEVRPNNELLRLLDFGCGWGTFPAVAAMFGCEAYGVDFDAERRNQTPIGLKVYRDLAGLDAEVKQPFHAITLFEVLEHLVDPMATLRALRDRLVPGGVLVLEVPNCEGVSGIGSESDYRLIHPLDHINAFSPQTLRSFAARAGFEAIVPPAAYVTTDLIRVAKNTVRRVVDTVRRTTRAYFRLARQ